MISVLRRAASSTIARPGAARARRAARSRARRRASPIACASSSRSFARRSPAPAARVERQLERDDDHAHRDDRRAPLGREPAGEVDRPSRLAAVDDRDEDVAVLERERRPDQRAAPRRSPSAARARRGAGRRRRRRSRPRASRGRPSASPGSGRRRRARRAPVASPPKSANSGQSTPRTRRFGRARNAQLLVAGSARRSATIDACATVNESIAPNAYIVPRKLGLPGSRTTIGASPAKTSSDEPRRLELRVQPAEDLRQLPVGRHRVRDPRGADHAGVRGDEQDRRGEDPDVDLQRVERSPPEMPRFSTSPSTGSFWKPPLSGGSASSVVSSPSISCDGQRRERDQRQREVDREDGDRDEADRARDALHRVARLLGQVRDGLDAGVRDHRRPGSRGRTATTSARCPSGRCREGRRAEDEREAEQRRAGAASRSRSTREEDVQPRRLLDADDVQERRGRRSRARRRRCPTGSASAAPRRSRGSAGRRTPRWRS